jgi:hypothetical protein
MNGRFRPTAAGHEAELGAQKEPFDLKSPTLVDPAAHDHENRGASVIVSGNSERLRGFSFRCEIQCQRSRIVITLLNEEAPGWTGQVSRALTLDRSQE